MMQDLVRTVSQTQHFATVGELFWISEENHQLEAVSRRPDLDASFSASLGEEREGLTIWRRGGRVGLWCLLSYV